MKLPLWLVKFRARRLYYSYCNELDEWDCGLELAEHINPNLRRMRLQLDALVDEIKKRALPA